MVSEEGKALIHLITLITYRFKYKPGWRFEVKTKDGVGLRILATVDNSYKPGEPVQIGSVALLPPEWIHWPEDRLIWWLHEEILRRETHELDEFFRVDDVVLFDPHKRGQT